MEKDRLTAVGIKYDEGLARFLGKKAVYDDLLRSFPESDLYSKAEEAFQYSDYDALYYYIQTLKGAAGNLSINGLYHRCSLIVNLLANKNYSHFSEEFEKLGEIHEKTCNAIITVFGEKNGQ